MITTAKCVLVLEVMSRRVDRARDDLGDQKLINRWRTRQLQRCPFPLVAIESTSLSFEFLQRVVEVVKQKCNSAFHRNRAPTVLCRQLELVR